METILDEKKLLNLKKKEVKQLKKRDNILNKNLWRVILTIVLPIMFYNLCNYLYGIYDMMVVQSANIGDAADIVVLDQIKNMISTVGGALATGGGIVVATKYGEKRIDEAKRAANVLFSMALVVAGITLLFIPIGKPFLQLLNTDQSTIDNAMGYYNVQILILFVTTINSSIIALEKSKGNTFILLLLNLGVIALKISLTTLFAYGQFENVTVTWLAVATLLAQLFLFIFGLVLCFLPSNILRIRFRELGFNKADCLKIIKLAFPVFVGRFLFSFGKVYVNSVATGVYGKDCVGALGISNTMAGLMANIINSFEDGGSTIVSQNYGNRNGNRIRKFYVINFVYILAVSVIGTLGLYFTKEQIAMFFAPNDIEYQKMIINIFKWECLDIVFVGLSGVASAVLYGLGKTKITMALSMSTLFLYRIPTLLILTYLVKMNYEACGIAVFTSNTINGIIAFSIVTTFIIRLPKMSKYSYLF